MNTVREDIWIWSHRFGKASVLRLVKRLLWKGEGLFLEREREHVWWGGGGGGAERERQRIFRLHAVLCLMTLRS